MNRFLWLALGICAAPALADEKPDPTALLRDSDQARGDLEQGLTWTVELTAVDQDGTTKRSFLVKARGDNALVESLAPARHKGELLLFNNRAIWFIKPDLRRPVAISPRQRLQGEAANGDIANTRYARDYDATLVGEDTVNGEPAWRLVLVAKAKDVTYDRIHYWISKQHHLGIKAEFLTVSGDIFKSATFTYDNRVKLHGAERDLVSRMIIRDAMGEGNVTTLDFVKPRAETHPNSMFNINNVLR